MLDYAAPSARVPGDPSWLDPLLQVLVDLALLVAFMLVTTISRDGVGNMGVIVFGGVDIPIITTIARIGAGSLVLSWILRIEWKRAAHVMKVLAVTGMGVSVLLFVPYGPAMAIMTAVPFMALATIRGVNSVQVLRQPWKREFRTWREMKNDSQALGDHD